MNEFIYLHLGHLVCRELSLKGKYDCTAGLQFDWFGFSRFSTFKLQQIFLFGQIQST